MRKCVSDVGHVLKFCYLCEENCPTGAIELIDGEVVLDNDKCIRCIECTHHCPVGALKRIDIE